MELGSFSSQPRCAAVWASASAVAGALVIGLLPLLAEAFQVLARGDLSAAAFDTVLVWCCATAAAAATGWLWLIVTLVTVEAARGVPAVRRGVPASLRRVVLALCGVALTSGLAAPALAAGVVAGADHRERSRLTGLRVPERVSVSVFPPTSSDEDAAEAEEAGRVSPREGGPIGAADSATADAAPPTVQQAGTIAPGSEQRFVVVDPGDTLWDLAAEQLGGAASTEETAAAWPAIYSLNRGLIGPDPGLIEPGQRLVLPPVGSATGPVAGSTPSSEGGAR